MIPIQSPDLSLLTIQVGAGPRYVSRFCDLGVVMNVEGRTDWLEADFVSIHVDMESLRKEWVLGPTVSLLLVIVTAFAASGCGSVEHKMSLPNPTPSVYVDSGKMAYAIGNRDSSDGFLADQLPL